MTRTALITGGTRGMGAAIARTLAGDGYRVVATDHGSDEAAAFDGMRQRGCGRIVQIAHAVRYLVSDEAAFTTGATLTVNGEQHMV